jgi:hypothetical protein
LHLTRAITISSLIVPAANYGVLQDFFESVRTADTEQTVLSAPATAALP